MSTTVRAILVLGAFALLVSGCKEAERRPSPRSVRHEVSQVPQPVIWKRPTEAALTTDDLYLRVPLWSNEAVARRFRPRVSGRAVRGAVYVIDIEPSYPQGLEVVVSVRGNLAWRPDGERLGATRIRVHDPKNHDGRAYRAAFGMRCDLKGDKDYWLTIEPGWPPQSVSASDGRTQPLKSVLFLLERTTLSDTIHRRFAESAVGPIGDDCCAGSLAAELEILEHVDTRR